jgi:hypothetical protein
LLAQLLFIASSSWLLAGTTIEQFSSLSFAHLQDTTHQVLLAGAAGLLAGAA